MCDFDHTPVAVSARAAAMARVILDDFARYTDAQCDAAEEALHVWHHGGRFERGSLDVLRSAFPDGFAQHRETNR